MFSTVLDLVARNLTFLERFDRALEVWGPLLDHDEAST